MVTIDLNDFNSITEVNAKIRECGRNNQAVEIINPDARHNIGVGLVDPITVRVKGSAGYFCGGLTDGACFEIESNAGWAVGDNIYNGTVIVGGNAGAIAGVGLRGGEVVIRGNMGSRAGQVMKAAATKRLDLLQKITELLPGVEHPSIMPLEGSDRIAIHAVCGETIFWEHLEALKAVGASAILVLPVEKMLA